MRACLVHGARVAVVVDPEGRLVEVYRSGREVERHWRGLRGIWVLPRGAVTAARLQGAKMAGKRLFLTGSPITPREIALWTSDRAAVAPVFRDRVWGCFRAFRRATRQSGVWNPRGGRRRGSREVAAWYDGPEGVAHVPVLTREMEEAVERLRAVFEPEEIVLFGSRAYGTAREDSDMDLLLVLRRTDEPQAERQRRARAALGAGGWRYVNGHIWAYTPDELVEELRRGSTAVRDALARGERLFPPGGRSRYAHLAGEWSATGAKETLLEKAREDLIVAHKALEAPVVPWGAAFHAQQAAEKALKALIYHLGGEPERTHSLSELALRASELDPVRGRALFLRYQPRLAELEKHAVQPRYIDVPAVGEEEAREAVELARAVLADVAGMLGGR